MRTVMSSVIKNDISCTAVAPRILHRFVIQQYRSTWTSVA